MALLGPSFQVVGLPDLEVPAAITNSCVPGCTGSDRQVSGDQEEGTTIW